MNEIAETPSYTALPTIKSATSFPKIRHRTQFAINRPRRIPPRIQRITSLLRRILILEARVYIANQVVVVVVAHYHLFDLAVFAHLAPEIFVEGIEVVLQLRGVHARLVVVGGVLVEVREEDGLRVGGFDVFARAAVAVAAGADFVVEGAVDLVLLCAEDGGEIVGHDEMRCGVEAAVVWLSMASLCRGVEVVSWRGGCCL